MSLRLPKNQYRGVNAHLHSRLQNISEGWQEFHGVHITHLAEAINRVLPSGYVVSTEKSSQIRAFHPDSGEEVRIPRGRRKARPDITVFDSGRGLRTPETATGVLTAPTMVLPASNAIDEEEIYLTAVAIHVIEDDEIGAPVTWIELLSPTNKPGGTGYLQYSEKRILTLRAGLVLVEIDYLHQSTPLISRILSYADGDSDAYPYHITVTNPRPSLTEGKLEFYGIGVDAPIPTVSIPLAGDDTIALDFNAVYNHTFESLGVFSRRVDYASDPERLNTYTPDDQQRIHERMTTVINDNVSSD